MTRLILFAVTISALLHAEAFAADPRHPDWPCVQIKVPEISITAVWSGPVIEGVGRAWESDPKVKDLVARLALRRVPLEEAEKDIADFITGDAAAKAEKAKLLFAGLFDTMNAQRGEVISGIERFTRRQREFAERIRDNTRRMRELSDAAALDQAKIDELSNQLAWDTRIFEDRRKSTRYVCEVPTAIERRLFALARAIQQALE
jgi:hypothetical protein